MPRLFFRRITARFAPATARITGNSWVRKYLPSLADPDLWLFTRRSTARGIAIGLACGLIPGPRQALSAALACVALRGNFPLAAVTTFYTNPLTIVPLYVVAYQFGGWFVPGARDARFAWPPDMSFDLDGVTTFLHWALSMGQPLAIGLPLLAATLGAAGFVAVNVMWRCQVMRSWRRRARLRARA